MTEPKKFSKAWFKNLVATADNVKSQKPELTLHLLLNDLRDYIAHLDDVDSRRGAPGRASEKRINASRLNGQKGGRPKGSKNKKQDSDE